jgi:pyruvate kinase
MRDRKSFSKTKIVCTLGPASQSIECIDKLIQAGMDVARLNFSHGTHQDHLRSIENVRMAGKKTGENICIVQDLCGPKIRIGKLSNGEAELIAGEKYIFTIQDILGDSNKVSVNYKELPQDVKKGDFILLDDGNIKLQVKSVSASEVVCTVLNGGVLKDHKGMNLPGVKLSTPSLTEKDMQDLKFGIANEIDYVALSFVRSVNDILHLRSVIQQFTGKELPIIAKIEMKEAVDCIDEIVEASDAVMVARGDLGVAMNPGFLS